MSDREPASLELFRLRIPLLEPFVAAHGTEHERDVVLVRLEVGDQVGWGECSTLTQPTYTGEHTAAAWLALRDELGPALLAGRPWSDAARPMASAALDVALVDALLRAEGIALSDELGGTRASVPSCAVVGIALTIDDLLVAVERRVQAGHRHVKLKVRPGWDVAPLRAVRGTWPDVALAADANGSYRVVDEVPVEVLDQLALAYLEQPFPADDLESAVVLASRTTTPVALDESLRSLAATRTALELGAASVVSVKPARLGGLPAAVAVARTAAAHGAAAFVGGMLETGIGRAAALAVASLDACTLPTDLGPSANYVAEDVTEPFTLVDGRLAVPRGPGIGVEPLADRLERFTVDHHVVRASA